VTLKKAAVKIIEFFTSHEFEGIPFEVVRRRVKYSRVEFKTGGLRVIVPRGINPFQVLNDNREVILKRHYRLQTQMETAQDITMMEWSVMDFQIIVTRYLHTYSAQLNVAARGIKFRKMKRRWGSCRHDGVITLNSFLRFLPETLIAYVVYHELTHLVVHGHNRDFKRVIVQEFPNYRLLDKELNLYGLKLFTRE